MSMGSPLRNFVWEKHHHRIQYHIDGSQERAKKILERLRKAESIGLAAGDPQNAIAQELRKIAAEMLQGIP
jgi:hypothetical protein